MDKGVRGFSDGSSFSPMGGVDMNTAQRRMLIFNEISSERYRQDQKHPAPSGFAVDLRMEILVEEVGEVAKAKFEGDFIEMRKELLEVAAVCVRWVESMDSEAIDSFRDRVLMGISPTEAERAFYREAVKRTRL